MNILDALAQGRRIQRESESWYWLERVDNGSVLFGETGEALVDWNPAIASLLAKDWVVVVDKKTFAEAIKAGWGVCERPLEGDARRRFTVKRTGEVSALVYDPRGAPPDTGLDAEDLAAEDWREVLV